MASEAWKKENADRLREYRRRWYEKNKKKQMQRQYEYRKELREWLADLKDQLKCARCPEDHVACLEFHHKDPTEKECNIGTIIRDRGWGKDRILDEIAKCEVLCSNCHRKEHWNQKHTPMV